MAGKDKLERGFRLLWDNAAGTPVDLSNDLIPGSAQGGGITLDQVDFTGVSDFIRKFRGGFGSSPVNASFDMNDTAATGATTVLNATLNTVGTLTLRWGSNGAAPIAGDLEWEGEYVLLSNSVSASGGKMVHAVQWQPAPSTADPAWGTM